MKRLGFPLLLTLAVAAPATADSIGPVTVHGQSIDHLGRYDSVIAAESHWGVGTFSSSMADGRVTLQSRYGQSLYENGASLAVSFSQSIEERRWSYDERSTRLATTTAVVRFAIEQDMAFSITGAYGGLGMTSAGAYLKGSAGRVFSHSSHSLYGAGGDFDASGVLAAGSYDLCFTGRLQDRSSAEWAASHAHGNLLLTLSTIELKRPRPQEPELPILDLEPESPKIQPVPEPGTWALLALAGLGLILGRKP